MDVQGLNIGILRYLEKLKETKVGDEDAKESLEVAIQCLCEVFHIDQDSFEGTSEPDLTVLYDEYQKRASDLRDGDRKRKSESLKSQGNIELKNGNLQSALDLYTQAIYTDGDNAVFYCNRALVYIKLGDLFLAHKDCQRAIELNPNYSRAYGRKGYIFKAQNKWRDAKAAYLKALEIDSGNAEYQAQLQEIEAKIQEDSRSSSTEGFPGGLNFEQFLQNPQFMHAASQMMSTPMFRSMATNLASQMTQPQNEGSQDSSGLMQNMQSMASAFQQYYSAPPQSSQDTAKPDDKDQVRKDGPN